MTSNSFHDLRRNLEPEFAPHSITVGTIVDAAGYVTIEAQRTNSSAKQQRFILGTVTMTPTVLWSFATRVRAWCEEQH